MKIVSLCSETSCWPVVRITDTQVEIGEDGKLVSLPGNSGKPLGTRYLEKRFKIVSRNQDHSPANR